MAEDSLNGFTGFRNRDPHFESAKDYMQKMAREADAAQNDPRYLERQAQAQSSAFSAAMDAARPRRPLQSQGMEIYNYVSPQGPDGILDFDPEKLSTIEGPDRRWSWVEIDLGAIRHNCSEVKRRLPQNTHLMAVVKADGYGHGAVQCAKMALNSGADYLGVATVNEGIELRQALINAPVLVLSEPPREAIPLLLAYRLMPSIYTSEFAIAYAEAADAMNLSAPYHLAVNTGMNRIGVQWDDVANFARAITFHRALELVGTFTHFATADSRDRREVQIQTTRFLGAIEELRANGIDPGLVHAANSAAAIRYPDLAFDMVRLGISLYGFYPCPEAMSLIDLRPAMSVKARITDVRSVKIGDGVSYGLTYRPTGLARICTLPIGYADGLRRGLSGRCEFLFDGHRYQQVGRICMDQCMFEVDMRTHGSRFRREPQIGDEVVIVGAQDEAVVTIEAMCQTLDTIPHEIAIGFGCSRMPRLYK